MHVIICWVTGLYHARNWLPHIPPSTPLSSVSTFTLSHSRPAWIWAVKRSSRRVWLAHLVESLNIQGGLSFEAAPGSPFVSEAALFVLTYAKWSLTWGKPQKNTSGTSEVLSPTLQHLLGHVCFYIFIWFVCLAHSLLALSNSMFIPASKIIHLKFVTTLFLKLILNIGLPIAVL